MSDTIRDAAQALLDRLDESASEVARVFKLAPFGQGYQGRDWGDQIAALRAALADATVPTDGGEANAVARLQEIALLAGKALMPTGIPDVPPPTHVMLVCTRASVPRGERFMLVPGHKSPRGELMNVKPNGERFDCLGRFPALDVLAFCMAKLDELGAPCPVKIASAVDQ